MTVMLNKIKCSRPRPNAPDWGQNLVISGNKDEYICSFIQKILEIILYQLILVLDANVFVVEGGFWQ